MREPIEQKRLGSPRARTSIWASRMVTSSRGRAGQHERHRRSASHLRSGSADCRRLRPLPIPYRAVATDMVTGKMVVLDRGDLATAMRASMAVPGAFAPVPGTVTCSADGGQVRNIPIDVARGTCARSSSSSLVEPETPPEKLVQSTQLVARSMEVMLEANENVQLATLTDRDLRIDVPMGDIGSTQFQRVPEAIPLGEAAARKVADRLAAYTVPEAEYIAWRNSVTKRQGIDVRVAAVAFRGLERVNAEYLRTLTRIKRATDVNAEAISHDAMRMSALKDVDTVAYRLEGMPRARRWSGCPRILGGAQRPESQHGRVRRRRRGHEVLLGAQYVRHWLNDRGGQCATMSRWATRAC